ncbi:hypothetical protein, partial [Roseibacillus persicicus]|uniref:hypothetical protein n=1 Tax=Roseibacillus persicicus TaxID=454148 RepID=UPI001E5E269A
RPTQRTFTGSITFPPPVNLRLASAVGFVVLRIVRCQNIAISELFEDRRNFYDGMPSFEPRQ